MAAVELLQQLLRIDTTNPPGNEAPAAELLEARLRAAGLETQMLAAAPGRPNLIARIPGPRDAPALVLLSHLDVVGAETESWTHDPFGGEIHDGAVWGRGALDMKGIAAMHAVAIEQLAAAGGDPRREVILVAVADEEAGGEAGAGWLVDAHPELVGLADGRPRPDVLGEGAFGLTGIVDRPVMPIARGEKTAVWMELRVQGDAGHGMLPPARQAPRRLARALGAIPSRGPVRIHPVMREQLAALSGVAGGARGLVLKVLASRAGAVAGKLLASSLARSGVLGALLMDTATPTQISAGYKSNVVPGEATASVDCRLLPDTDVDRFVERVERRIGDPDATVVVRGRHGGPVSEGGPVYEILRSVSSRVSEAVVVPTLTTGFTDLRYFRRVGARAYGWAPLVISPELVATIHGHDERVPIGSLEAATGAVIEAVHLAAQVGGQ